MDDITKEIMRLRKSGKTNQAISDLLNSSGTKDRKGNAFNFKTVSRYAREVERGLYDADKIKPHTSVLPTPDAPLHASPKPYHIDLKVLETIVLSNTLDNKTKFKLIKEVLR